MIATKSDERKILYNGHREKKIAAKIFKRK